jgi:hypothetical protein
MMLKAAAASICPDLRLSVLKPLHAKWLMESFEAINNDLTSFKVDGIRLEYVLHLVWMLQRMSRIKS